VSVVGKPLPDSRPAASPLKDSLSSLAPTLRRVSRDLFENPELSGEESKACSLLASLLSENGFKVEKNVANLATAFLARYAFGDGGHPQIGLFCEYDALPELGHACGHNLIASASLVAGLALAKGLDLPRGEVWVIGSPAEETFGGKVSLLRSGHLADLDAAMMFHPGPETRVCSLRSVATAPTEIVFYPERIPGIAQERRPNPVLAVASLFQSIQSVASGLSGASCPGVILEGGRRPNLTPKRTVARFSFRAKTQPLLRRLMHEVLRCVREASRTSDCSFSMRRYEAGYEPLLVNQTIGKVCERYLQDEGLAVLSAPPESPGAYDIGNVSRCIPVIHPIINRGFEGVLTHTEDFAERAGSEEGIQCATLAAKVLALTAQELLTQPELLAAAQDELSHEIGPKAGQ